MKRASQRLAKESKKTRAASADDEFLRIARARFQLIQSAESKQREREREDIRFYDGEQWDSDIIAARQGKIGNGNLPDVPSRPTITINKAREPVRQVLNQERQTDLGVTIVPADDFAGLAQPVDEDEITLREGLVRRIQRVTDAKAARTWAFERAVIAGRGYYGVMVRFVPGKTWDREVYVERFYDQSDVSLGPHDQPDGSDADHGFVGSYLPWDEYTQKWPKAKDKDNPLIGQVGSDADFMALGAEYPGWFTFQGTAKNKTKMCRVVRYWYTERTSRNLALLPDGTAAWKDEVPEGITPIDTRPIVDHVVKCAIIDGSQVLEQTDWEGKYIPIIKVLGEELQPYDGERRSEGMVRPSIEPGRAFNVLVSKLVETIGHTPLQPLILDPESIEGWEDWYKLAATRAFPYLPQRSRGDDGREFREAHRPDVDPNLQPMAMAIGMFDQFIQSTTGVHDPSNGKSDPAIRSGKMQQALVAQDAHGTSNFIDNLARSVNYEGLIENDLLYPIYGKPGRIAKILNPAGEPESVMLHQPFTMAGGKPQAVTMAHPTDATKQIPAPMGTPGMPPEAKTYVLTKDAGFNVAIKVGKNVDLRRDQLADFLGQLISARPEFMGEYGDMFFKALDVPDHEELAERAKVMLVPPVQQAIAAKKQGLDVPPAVQAHLSQMQKQLQELEQIVAKQQHDLDTDKVKYDSQERIEKMKLDLAAAKTQADNETKLAVAELGAKVDRLSLFLEERARLGVQAHDAAISAADAAHTADLSAQESQQAQGEAEQAHGHALEQGAQAPPVDPNAAPAEPAQAGA